MKKILPLIIAVFAGICGVAAVLHVPQQYTTVQAAINAALNGDTVLVSPGTYYENIQFRGKGITVASLYLTTRDTTYIDATVINGSQPVHADTASCVIIRGSSLVSSNDSTAALIGFRITGGTGTRWEDEHGPGSWYREGGGILVQYLSPRIGFNHITFNQATSLQNCVSAGGGAIRCGDGNPKIFNNIIDNNQGRYGGALVFNFSGAVIKNNVIAGNSGGEDFGGGAIWAYGSDGLSRPRVVENNTIVNNASTTVGGGIRAWSTTMTIRNTILWGNTAPNNPQINYSGTAPVVQYSDIQGGYSGSGNLNVTPLFGLQNYYLAATSPCIDKGDSTAVYNDPQDPLTPGMALPPAKGTLRNDMGAYGGSGSAGMAAIPTIYTSVTGVNAANPVSLNLYPNPCTGLLMAEYRQSEQGMVKAIVFNSDGKIALSLPQTWASAGNHSMNVAVAGLAPGTYLFSIETEGVTVSRLFIKQ